MPTRRSPKTILHAPGPWPAAKTSANGLQTSSFLDRLTKLDWAAQEVGLPEPWPRESLVSGPYVARQAATPSHGVGPQRTKPRPDTQARLKDRTDSDTSSLAEPVF